MSQNISIFSLAVTLAEPVDAHTFVGYGGDRGGAILGVAQFGGKAGDVVTVDVLGTAQLLLSSAVGVGDALFGSADGTGIGAGPHTGSAPLARALQAGNEGDVIEVLLIPN